MAAVNMEDRHDGNDLDAGRAPSPPPPEYEQVMDPDHWQQRASGNAAGGGSSHAPAGDAGASSSSDGASQGETSTSARQVPQVRQPRSNAQKAFAPVTVRLSNHRISEDYVVVLPRATASGTTANPATAAQSSPERPDVLIRTSNGQINSTVFFRQTGYQDASASTGDYTTAFVRVESANAALLAGFPEVGNLPLTVNYAARTSNGRIELELPKKFRGVVSAETTNAKVVLSDDVKGNSILVANPPGSLSHTVSYCISPFSTDDEPFSQHDGQQGSSTSGGGIARDEKKKSQDQEEELGSKPPQEKDDNNSNQRSDLDKAEINSIPTDIYDQRDTSFNRCHLHTSNAQITIRYWNADESEESQSKSSGCVIT